MDMGRLPFPKESRTAQLVVVPAAAALDRCKEPAVEQQVKHEFLRPGSQNR